MARESYRWSACQTVRALQQEEISPADLVETVEARYAAVNGAVNAIVTPCFERASDAARKLMALPPQQRGLLAGLPIAVKDLNDVAGVRTTYGSPIFADNVPKVSDLMVQTLEANGAIVVGMSNSPEFGAGGNTFNEVHGATRNPWNLALSAGGSSGGSAAALATGQVWLATGSDLGGSLRLPASHCSVVGLRPSPGRVAAGPDELRFNSLSVDGPMARNVEDAALMLDAMAGWSRELPFSLEPPAEPFLSRARAPKKPKRIALSLDLGGVTPVDRQTRHVVRDAMERLAAEGIEVVEDCPDFGGAMDAFQTLRAAGFVAGMNTLLKQHPHQLKPEVIWNIEKGRAITGEQLAKAELRRSRLYADCVRFLKDVDLLIVPSACIPPTAVEERWVSFVDGHRFEDYVGWLTITATITLTALPVLAIPAGFTSDKRPVGVQLVGQPRGEGDLLSFGAAIEQILKVEPATPIDPIAG